MKNINFNPAYYKAIAFMACMMLLMVLTKSKAAYDHNFIQTNINKEIKNSNKPAYNKPSQL